MLDDVQGRRFPEQPAGKNPFPLIFARTIRGALIDQKLDKGSLLGCQFPRRGPFAGTQADDCAADPDRLAGPKFKIARQAITLVEKAERRNAFRHRRADLLGYRSDQVAVGCGKFLFLFRLAGGMFLDGVATEPAAATQQ